MKKVLFIFLLLIVCIPIAYYFNAPSNARELSIINPIDLNPEMVDAEPVSYTHLRAHETS